MTLTAAAFARVEERIRLAGRSATMDLIEDERGDRYEVVRMIDGVVYRTSTHKTTRGAYRAMDNWFKV